MERSDSEGRTWNAQQAEILEDAASGTGDTVVVARAGTGKTTTMLEAARRFPRGASVCYLAFNSRIKEEVSRKAPQGVDVRTLHSLGRGALFLVAKGSGRQLPDPAGDKTRKLVERTWPAPEKPPVGALASAVGFAKNTLASTAREIEGIVYRLDLDVDVDPVSPKYREALAWFCGAVIRLLDLSVQAFNERLEYDFDDMIWLPVRCGWRVKQFDRVIVDEGQDLNACQHRLARMARRNGGRIVLVGDDRQAIYAWRGAAEGGMDRFAVELGAKVLRLPVTYRCGQVIVGLAKTAVADYEAAPSNPQGMVDHASEVNMVAQAEPGDAVLSRVNAPLVGLCLQILKTGKRARVVGRDVGRGLLALISDAEKDGAVDVPQLVAWVDAWRSREVDRLLSRDPPKDTDIVEDRAECLVALTEGVKTIAAVRARIADLFTDDPTRGEVVLSSTHKAKGLEWSTVWMLADTYRPHRSTEEQNVWYVAVTRAISRLVLVSKAHEAQAHAASPSEVVDEPAPVAVEIVPTAVAPKPTRKVARRRKGEPFAPSAMSPLWAPILPTS